MGDEIQELKEQIASLEKKLAELTIENDMHSKVCEVDNVVEIFTGENEGNDPREVLSQGLASIAEIMGVPGIFICYDNPRTFTENEITTSTLILSDDSYSQKFLQNGTNLDQAVINYKFQEVLKNKEDPNCLWTKIGDEFITGTPIFSKANKVYVGTFGAISDSELDTTQFRVMEKAAEGIGRYVRSAIKYAESHRITRLIAHSISSSKGLEGVVNSMKLLCQLTEAPNATLVYLEEAPDDSIPVEKRKVGMIVIENGVLVKKEDSLKILNRELDALGGPMVEYDRKAIGDSKDGLMALGITTKNHEKGTTDDKPYQVYDCVNRQDNNYISGKLFLIGKRLRRHELNTMEHAANLIEHRLSVYHEKKILLQNYVHPEIANFFVDKPEIAEWFFEEAREEIVGMVFTDVCDYTSISAKAKAKEVISTVRNWIIKETDLTLEFGGLFDKEIGDCAVSLFGPPFCGVKLEDLKKIDTVEELKALVESSQSEPHVYAFNAVRYALASKKAITEHYLADEQLDISIGIEVGPTMIGSITKGKYKLTSISKKMNLASRIQGIAGRNKYELPEHLSHMNGDGKIFIGPQCAEYLKEYRKERYRKALPFEIEQVGEKIFKGFNKPEPFFIVYEK